MDSLIDIYRKEQLKEKRIRNVLIAIAVVLGLLLIYLFTIDPWDIAYDKESKAIEARKDEFLKTFNSDLLNGEYLEAYYIDNELNLYGSDYDLYSLLSDYKEIVENIRNEIEGKSENNYYDLEYLLDSFFNDYFYAKKYHAPSNYFDDIKDEIEEYLSTYGLISSDTLNEIKERNNYE